MQMYKVAFTSQRGALVESGVFLVCASDAEAAEKSVAAHASLPPSTARFEVARVKPSIYELRRTEHQQSQGSPHSSGSARDDGAEHEVRVSAVVYGYSEANVTRKLAAALTEQYGPGRVPLPRFINELDVGIQRRDERPKASRVEEQSIYRETRFFPGGAARPR